MCASSVVTIVLMLQGQRTGPDGALHVASANGLVGTGFASRYRLQQFMATGPFTCVANGIQDFVKCCIIS